jgi:predicted RNase H-like HicB family nuclease
MNPEYAVQIIWSQEDQAYVAVAFELPGCAADGETPEEALTNLRVVIAEWIEVAKEEGREIPKPMSREDFDRIREAFQRDSERKMREQVETRG